MKLIEMFRSNAASLQEGGNVAIGQHQAQQINLQVTNRSYIVPILNKLLSDISVAYSQQYQTPLWEPKLLKSQKFLSGSSLHFFNVKGIPDQTFVEKKPKVGDIDTMVAKDKEANLEKFLTAMSGKQIGSATLIGFQRGNEQFSSLWELQDPPIKIQIDLEFVQFDKEEPTAWSRFSHSSSWEDIQSGVKGVFHKFLIQSFSVLTKRQFLLRKQVGRGKAKEWQDVPTEDGMISFAVSSKEGGGLRAKYTPVINPQTNEPEIKDGLPVMMALPAAGYEQDINKIFQNIFGVRMGEKAAKKLEDKFWSFTGLLDVMNTLLDKEEKDRVLGSFLTKVFGKGAQGLYKNDPERDAAEKNAAIDLLIKQTGAQPPEGMDIDQMRQEYTASYKMTEEALDEADDITAPAKPNYARQGIKHIYNRLPDGRVSSMEMSNTEFQQVAQEIAENGGNLDGMAVNLKVDGAGIRFGKDENGRPFMMTSKVTTPLYADNVGYFTNFGREKGQDAETLARTKKYDDALALITGSKFIQTLPNDTIVQAEMMYVPMAQTTDQGLKFVNISYNPKKLGKEMTLVPFMVKQFSTGEERPDADKILNSLTAASDNNIKIVTNRLEQKGINVSKIIQPILDIDPKNKENKPLFDKAKQELSDAIISSPRLKGKDSLGENMEGIVVNLPSGRLFKVTSQQMNAAIAAKNAPVLKREGGNKTAVVAIGSFVGHVGHEQLWDYTLKKAESLGGDPYLFIGNAVGADDPIPPSVKVQTWHKMYPQYAKNISTVTQEGGTLMQKIKHELINPMPGQPPKYDNIVIMVGEDQAGMNIANALMKAVNKFSGYEHVKVTLEPTPRGTGMSFTKLRNILKDPNATPEQQYAIWAQGFDEAKLGKDWILKLMDIARKGMGITQKPVQQTVPQPVAETRLFNALIRPSLSENKDANPHTSALGKALYRDLSKEKKASPQQVQRNKERWAKRQAEREQGVAEGAMPPSPTPLSSKGAEAKKAKSKEQFLKKKAAIQNKFNHKPDDWSQDFERRMKNEGVSEEAAGVGVIASKKQAKDPRYSMSLTKDVRPGQIKKNLDAFSLERAEKNEGIPTDREFAYQGYKIKFTPTQLVILKGGDVALTRPGDFSNPTKQQLTVAKRYVEKMWQKDKEEQQTPNIGHQHDLYGITKEYEAIKKEIQNFLKPFEKERAELRTATRGDKDAWYTGINALNKKYQNSPELKALKAKQENILARMKAIKKGSSWKDKDLEEKMLPKSAFAGTGSPWYHKLGDRGQAKGKQKGPVKRGQMVGGDAEESIEREDKQRLDPKCWTGYRKAGTKMKGDVKVNNCVPVSEDIERIMTPLVESILAKYIK